MAIRNLFAQRSVTGAPEEFDERWRIISGWCCIAALPFSRVGPCNSRYLMSEVLGYNLQYSPHVPASSIEVMYAMIGCKTWYNRESRGCDKRKQELHLAVESWHLSYPTTWEIIRQSYPAEVPLSVDMGYVGTTGQFVSASVVEAAENSRGLALDYYKSYNPKWHHAAEFFDNISAVNTSYFEMNVGRANSTTT